MLSVGGGLKASCGEAAAAVHGVFVDWMMTCGQLFMSGVAVDNPWVSFIHQQNHQQFRCNASCFVSTFYCRFLNL